MIHFLNRFIIIDTLQVELFRLIREKLKVDKNIEILKKYVLDNEDQISTDMLEFIEEYLNFLVKTEEKVCRTLNEMENSKENIDNLNKQISELLDLRGLFDV